MSSLADNYADKGPAPNPQSARPGDAKPNENMDLQNQMAIQQALDENNIEMQRYQ